MLEVVGAAVVGYLLGTLPSADIVCRFVTRGRVDLRSAGSGNPGGLNAMKEIGTAWGIVVIAADVVKGVGAGFAGMAIAGDAGGYAAASTAIAGHIFPAWSRFKGGKGVATSAGSCLAVFPAYFPVDVVVGVVGAARTRHPERTIWGNAAVWVVGALIWWLADLPNLWGPDPSWGLVAFSVIGAGLIVGKFRAAARAAARRAAAATP